MAAISGYHWPLALPSGYFAWAWSTCSAAGAEHPIIRGVRRLKIAATAEVIRKYWGTGRIVKAAAPGLADDLHFAARWERAAASPSTAAAMYQIAARSDVSQPLDLIQAPTLVVHSGDLRFVEEAATADLAARIAGAQYLRQTSTSFYWSDDTESVWDDFISGTSSHSFVERDLVALLVTDVVSSTEQLHRMGDEQWRLTLDFLDDVVAREVGVRGGRVVKQTGDGHLAEFPRPIDALEAAVALQQRAKTLGVALRAGVHFGEVERRNDDLAGLTVHIAARIAAEAMADELLVSRTIVDLSPGANFDFVNRGSRMLKGVPEPCTLSAANRKH
jgi:class 3 adenylate cyclase